MHFPHLRNAYQNRLIGQSDLPNTIECPSLTRFCPATSSASSLFSSRFLHFSTSEDRLGSLQRERGQKNKSKMMVVHFFPMSHGKEGVTYCHLREKQEARTGRANAPYTLPPPPFPPSPSLPRLPRLYL